MLDLKRVINGSRRVLNKNIGIWFRFKPDINPKTTFLGTSYGGWSILDIPIKKNSIIYSFGIGEDISFDLELINKYGVTIYAYDPIKRSIDWVKKQKVSKLFKPFQIGIANYDGIANFAPPINPKNISHTILNRSETQDKAIKAKVNRLKTLMKKNGHDKIDILKLDIEGAEYDVIDDILNSNVEITHLLIEFHHRFENIGFYKTYNTVKKLKRAGFKLYYVSEKGEDYCFIKK